MSEANIRMSIEKMAQELSWTKEWNAPKIKEAILNQLKPLKIKDPEDLRVRLWGDISQYPVDFSVYFTDVTTDKKDEKMVGDGTICYRELVIIRVRTPDRPRPDHKRRATWPSIEIFECTDTLVYLQNEPPTKLF